MSPDFEVIEFMEVEKQILVNQNLIGPPAARLLIRGNGWASDDWIRDCELPRYAGLATEHHRGGGHWLPLPAAWMDASNWVGGYWRPWR